MNKQLEKELTIIKLNNEEATKEIKQMLGNDKLTVDLSRYNAAVYFGDEEILRTDRDRDGKVTSSFRVYSMRVNTNTSDDVVNDYADFLELAAKMMRMKERINERLGYYITKTGAEITNSYIVEK